MPQTASVSSSKSNRASWCTLHVKIAPHSVARLMMMLIGSTIHATQHKISPHLTIVNLMQSRTLARASMYVHARAFVAGPGFHGSTRCGSRAAADVAGGVYQGPPGLDARRQSACAHPHAPGIALCVCLLLSGFQQSPTIDESSIHLCSNIMRVQRASLWCCRCHMYTICRPSTLGCDAVIEDRHSITGLACHAVDAICRPPDNVIGNR